MAPAIKVEVYVNGEKQVMKKVVDKDGQEVTKPLHHPGDQRGTKRGPYMEDKDEKAKVKSIKKALKDAGLAADANGNFTCLDCNKKCTTRSSAERHMMVSCEHRVVRFPQLAGEINNTAAQAKGGEEAAAGAPVNTSSADNTAAVNSKATFDASATGSPGADTHDIVNTIQQATPDNLKKRTLETIHSDNISEPQTGIERVSKRVRKNAIFLPKGHIIIFEHYPISGTDGFSELELGKDTLTVSERIQTFGMDELLIYQNELGKNTAYPDFEEAANPRFI